MAKRFYITTTLPYINADPHIGFALEIIQADALARYKNSRGYDVFFNTGTDEHGAKIYERARQAEVSPQKYCDQQAARFARLREKLNLTFNSFTRTTGKGHIKAAQEFWRRCDARGDIYKKTYKTRYCVGCELEKTDSELIAGRCPIHPHRDLETIEEENYFFKFSKYQDDLLRLYKSHPSFVIPRSRHNEIRKFVERGLRDFSISRLKTKLPWGVPVPGDKKQVMYVWFDALVNYISALGWPEDKAKFEAFWPGTQVAGKDNLRQQAAMWQAMLMSAGLPNSTRILIHGFITVNGAKMSKSLGNVVNPFDLVEKYGTDAVRYYLLRAISPFKDGDFSTKRFEEIYNADLANGLGNLVARVAKLCANKNYSPPILPPTADQDYHTHMERFELNLALKTVWRLIKDTDVLLDRARPWEKSDEEAKATLAEAVENILNIAYALQPFLPETAEKIEKQFRGPVIKSEGPLFPRL